MSSPVHSRARIRMGTDLSRPGGNRRVPDLIAKTAAQILMERETRVAYGAVPHALSDDPLGEATWHLYGDRFLLRAAGEHYFYYRMGEGVTIERGAGADGSEESLWLNGTVYAAIASMNGLLPIHASAVALDGSVFAFTGSAGVGKSTLVAALGSLGLAMFCDDTLVLDLSDPDRIICLPGHKRLKLRPDAIELTGANPEEKVSLTVDKCYASPAAGTVGVALPLAELLFFEEGPEPAIMPISGSERFVRMQDDHQTSHLVAAARQFDRERQFEHFSRLARQIRMARFVRPRERSRFHESLALIEQYVTNASGAEITGAAWPR